MVRLQNVLNWNFILFDKITISTLSISTVSTMKIRKNDQVQNNNKTCQNFTSEWSVMRNERIILMMIVINTMVGMF